MFKARHDELLSLALFHGDDVDNGKYNDSFRTLEAWNVAGVWLTVLFFEVVNWTDSLSL